MLKSLLGLGGAPMPARQQERRGVSNTHPIDNERRYLLRKGLQFAAGVALASPTMGMAKNFTEAEMDSIDDLIEKRLSRKEGDEDLINPWVKKSGDKDQFSVPVFNLYIKMVKERAQKDGKGVHFQEHENAEIVADVYRQLYQKKQLPMDKDLIYYPHENSDFEKAASRIKDSRKEARTWESPHGTKTSTLTLLPGDNVFILEDNQLVAAVVDAGLGYVILPKNMPMIKDEKGKNYIGPCRNPVKAFYKNCPPCK